jgi:hypothetical protein
MIAERVASQTKHNLPKPSCFVVKSPKHPSCRPERLQASTKIGGLSCAETMPLTMCVSVFDISTLRERCEH